jgi:hypothetical protein
MSENDAYLTGDWVVISHDPMTGRTIEHMDLGSHIAVRTTYPSDDLMDLNAARRAENAGKRWGDGAVAASIPLNVYFDKFAEARQNNDSKYIKKLLNDSDFSKFRTKEGKL